MTYSYTQPFFQSSGPLLPVQLHGHSMVKLGKGQAILGGRSNEVHHSKIYSMTCSNRNCTIFILNRELSVPKVLFVAISIPDTISGCITNGKNDFQKPQMFYVSKYFFPLNYSMPVQNTDRGWFLPRLQQQSPLFF